MTRFLTAMVVALALLLPGSFVETHSIPPPPPQNARVSVNTCNGGVTGYKDGWVYGVTAAHCVHAPNNTISVEGTPLNGQLLKKKGDLAFIRWPGKKPGLILPVARELPRPGEAIWIAGTIDGMYLPIPGVWLGHLMELGNIKAYAFYGSVAAGFSGSPVLNQWGQLLGVVSIGTFIDSHDRTSIVAPWGGATLLPQLQNGSVN